MKCLYGVSLRKQLNRIQLFQVVKTFSLFHFKQVKPAKFTPINVRKITRRQKPTVTRNYLKGALAQIPRISGRNLNVPCSYWFENKI